MQRCLVISNGGGNTTWYSNPLLVLMGREGRLQCCPAWGFVRRSISSRSGVNGCSSVFCFDGQQTKKVIHGNGLFFPQGRSLFFSRGLISTSTCNRDIRVGSLVVDTQCCSYTRRFFNSYQSVRESSGNGCVGGAGEALLADDNDAVSESGVIGRGKALVEEAVAVAEERKYESDNWHFLFVEHLPRNADSKKLIRFLKEHEVPFKKVSNYNSRRSNAKIQFRREEDAKTAEEILNGAKWKSSTLVTRRVNHYEKVMKTVELTKQRSPVKLSEDEMATVLQNRVTPLWRLSYDEQLEIKQREVISQLKKYQNLVKKAWQRSSAPIPDWLMPQKLCADTRLYVDVEKVKPSPMPDYYRTKCQFTIGESWKGEPKAVGLRWGRFENGSVSVMEPDMCLHIPGNVNGVRRVFQEYFQNVSHLKGYDLVTGDGFWRKLTVKYAPLKQECLAMVHFHPQQLSKEEIVREKEALRSYLLQTEVDKKYNLVSVWGEESKELNNADKEENAEFLFGKRPYIQDEICGIKFNISSSTFSQPNSASAEVVSKTVADLIRPTDKTRVLDLCCGSGTLGLSIAGAVKSVTGIEVCESAVDDARMNADINGLGGKCEFICGKVEDEIVNVMRNKLKASDNTQADGNSISNSANEEEQLIREAETEEMTVILDPPRGGLPKKVMLTIRETREVRRLVYVSCSLPGAITNLLSLTRPASNTYKGEAFTPVKAVPIDMFPHTKLSEVAILLER